MPLPLPDQDVDPDSLDAMLVEALDSADLQRAALLLRLALLRTDQDRAADLDALRRDGLPLVYRA